jgi:hypothetical protein
VDAALLAEGTFVEADFVSITFPPHIQRVVNPLTAEGDYEFAPLARAANPIDRGITTQLIYSPEGSQSDLTRNTGSIDVLYHQHDCLADASGIEQKGGGGGCSTKMFLEQGQRDNPVVLYLEANRLKEVSRPGGVEPHADLPDELKCFLLPTMLPNSTLLWAVIDVVDDPAENRRNLLEFLDPVNPTIGFNSLIVFFDKVEMNLVLRYESLS